MSDRSIQHDSAAHRFWLPLGAGEAELRYEPLRDGVINIWRTYVPSPDRGRGFGAALVRHALEWAEAEGIRVVPSCWYVEEFVAREARFRGIIDRSGA